MASCFEQRARSSSFSLVNSSTRAFVVFTCSCRASAGEVAGAGVMGTSEDVAVAAVDGREEVGAITGVPFGGGLAGGTFGVDGAGAAAALIIRELDGGVTVVLMTAPARRVAASCCIA